MKRAAARKTVPAPCEQEKVEAALRKSEERYRRLVAAITDYVYTVRMEDGKPVETIHSPASVSVTGYAPDEFLADPYLWITMVDEEDRPAVEAQVEAIVSGQDVHELEHRIYRKDGQMRWIRNTVVSHRDGSGKLLSYDGLVVDITDRKVAEEKLREAYATLKETRDELVQAEKMDLIGRMASGVAHEVKNPLAIVMQGVNFLEDNFPRADARIAEVLGLIREGIDRADSIITALCDFSKKERLNLAPGDLNAILRSSLVLVESTLRLGQVTVSQDLEPGLPAAFVDARKMEQVFINIIRNAIQAMPDGGEISIHTYSAPVAGETAVMAELTDTGCGIAPADLKKIFEPFFSTKGPTGGTGLGLFVTRNIIDMHDGAIEIQSQEGKGTRVIVRLKAA